MGGIIGGLLGPGGVGGTLTQGGVGATPEETQFARFTGAEQSIKGQQDFSHGMGMSTNETMAAGVGPAFATAEELAKISDMNTAAQSNLINQNFNQFAGGLSQLLAGLGGGGFSGGGGVA
jgi:glycine betaine/choline ABC-type transport system substrate-binding protein